MKTIKTAVVALLLAPLGLLAQQQRYTLNGTIPKFTAGDKVYLLRGNTADSASFNKGGTFSFSGEIDGPVKSTLLVGKSIRAAYSNAYSFYLEPGKIAIKSKDSLHNAQTTAGLANKHNDELKPQLQQLNDQQNAVYAWYRTLSKEEQGAAATKNKLEETSEKVATARKNIYHDFVKKNPDSPIALDIVQSIAGYSPEYTEIYPLYQSLSDKVKTSAAGKKYGEELQRYEPIALGKDAPVFSQQDTAGNVVSLANFKGKYVLIDFWASWCGPCRVENPNVVTAFNTFKDKGFTIVGVSLDNPQGREAWLKAIHDDGLQQWTQLSDLKGWKNEAALQYAVRAIPANFLVDPTGKIIAKNLRGTALQAKLKEILN